MISLPKLILYAGMLRAATSFTIPEGTANGVYSVHTDESGIDIHTPLSDLPDPAFVERNAQEELVYTSRHSKRENGYWVDCGGTKNMNRGDTDAANADLDRQCGKGTWVGGRQNYYAIRGNVVAFFCNFNNALSGSRRCFDWKRGQESAAITKKCGLYNSGWTRTEVTGTDNYSYGYDSAQSHFCGT